MLKRLFISLFLLVLMPLVAACGAAAPETVTVVETVVVEKEVEGETVTVVETVEVIKEVEKEVVVTATPAPEEEAMAETEGEMSSEPVFGGVFRIAARAVPPTLDSQSTSAGATSLITAQIMETLVAFGEDYSIVPMLAESWDISEDGTTYTFNLREGIKFHNGEEMTAEDVIASMDRFLEVTARGGQFDIMESYEATDDYTIVMQLSSPSAAFLGTVASPSSDLVIFPKEVIEGKGKGEVGPDDLIGTGPYMLAEFIPDQMAVLERFEDYQPLDMERSGLGGGKIAYFDTIEIHFVPEAGARVAGLEVGDYDWVEAPPATDIGRLRADPNIQIEIVKPQAGIYVLFNHANEWSGDVKFRQAILAAMDMDKLGLASEGGQRELFDLNESIWPPQTPRYWEDDIAKEYSNQKNPDKAQQLLEELGYDGEEIVIATTRDYDYMYKTMIGLADQLDEIGLNIKIELYDWPSLFGIWEQTEGWHISVTGNNTLQLLDPGAATVTWDSRSTHPVSVHYSNPEMDAAFDALAAAKTNEERKELLKPILHIFWEDLPNIKVVERYPIEALRSDIMGYEGWGRGQRFSGVWRAEK
jgi:peptide/nickel transport system substrate-binding protein